MSKRQSEIVAYARGTGPVWIPLDAGAARVRVDAAKGLDYLPASGEVRVEGERVEVALRLRRWNRLREQGWRAADAHLHYDRVDAAGDRDWLAMMDGGDIAHAQFMVLKGGMVPGVWARQFAYGPAGETSGDGRTIVAGEEYRDQLQGHLLLFGLREVIQPIMAGVRDAPRNYPLFPGVLDRARELGALAGVAHGGTLGRSPTVFLDALLGKLEFIEIANWVTGLWPLPNWYRLLNCGYVLAPTAGSDLPNNPWREPWQPFLGGGMRMYARTGGRIGSAAWNAAVKRGETFVTNGPSIDFEVDSAGPGGLVCLPEAGGEVKVRIRMRSPRELQVVELVQAGRVAVSSDVIERDGDVFSVALETRLPVHRSTWLAVRGHGREGVVPGGAEVAHTAAVRVLVGTDPIRSSADAEALLESLARQKDFYVENGSYASEDHRRQMASLFDLAADELRGRLAGRTLADPSACATQ